MINFEHTYTPNTTEINQMCTIYNQCLNISIVQDVNYLQHTSDLHFFYLVINNEIKAYCIVKESKLSKLKFIKTAQINFGVISYTDDYKDILMTKIIDFYTRKKYSQLIVNFLNESFKYQSLVNLQPFDKLDKGTILIDLNAEIDTIHSAFSTELKRNLKKGINLGLKINRLENNHLSEMFDIYLKMSAHRQISHFKKNEFENIINYVLTHNKGFSLGCWFNEKLIGGMVCILQGNRIEYYIGFTDPDFKQIPQSHLTFFEALKLSKSIGIPFFDMGGVVTNAETGSQLFNITRFKLGFSKNTLIYQKTGFIPLNKTLNLIKKIYINSVTKK